MKNKIKILLYGESFNDKSKTIFSPEVFAVYDVLLSFERNNFYSDFHFLTPDIVVFYSDEDLSLLINLISINVPYIILGNNSEEEKIVEYLRNGAFDYVSINRFNQLDEILKKTVSCLKNKNETEALFVPSPYITGHKNQSDKSIKQFEDLFHNLDEIFYSFDVIKSQYTLMTPSCYSFFGISNEEFLKFPEIWDTKIYHEDINSAILLEQRKKTHIGSRE